MKERLFVPTKEERVFFSVYPGSIEEFVAWLPSYTGPFDQAEFDSMKPKSIQAMKDFAQFLRWGAGVPRWRCSESRLSPEGPLTPADGRSRFSA